MKNTGFNERTEKVNGRNVKLNAGEYIAWTYGGEYDEKDPYPTREAALDTRNYNFGHLYNAFEINRHLPVRKYIFTSSCGMESNVPVCSIGERLEEMNAEKKK